MPYKETLRDFLSSTGAEFSLSPDFVSVFTRGLSDSQVNRIFSLSDFLVVGLFRGPTYRLVPRKLIKQPLSELIISKNPCSKKRHNSRKYKKNSSAVLIGDSVESIVYRKGQPHKCDPECLAADHRYIHETESFQTALYGDKNGTRIFMKEFA